MASLGAKVLQTRSVAMAMRHNVNLQVRSSFTDAPGTLVVNEDAIVEQEKISGIAYSPDEATGDNTGAAGQTRHRRRGFWRACRTTSMST